ncbi:MAG: hypothetical protein AB1427_00800 [Thermodesulfobacteriota bacterium]
MERYRGKMSCEAFCRAVERTRLTNKSRLIGWDCLALGRSLAETAHKFSVTRERVRQVAARIRKA